MTPLETRARFAFGENWQRFLPEIDGERIARAEASLRTLLGDDGLRGATFLDAGCGSGLFSLAAVRLGAAAVRSFDYDEKSVRAAAELRRRYGGETDWTVEQGDVTDDGYTRTLGAFDVVYSWGVLHHTGSLWEALDNVCSLVASGGRLVVAVYNDEGGRSEYWRKVKLLYNRLPPVARAPYAAAVMVPSEAANLARSLLHGRPSSYLAEWTQPRARGMSKWRDIVDWVGGYPFEVAKPEEVFTFVRDRGFELVELVTSGGLGNNQFVFRRAQ